MLYIQYVWCNDVIMVYGLIIGITNYQHTMFTSYEVTDH